MEQINVNVFDLLRMAPFADLSAVKRLEWLDHFQTVAVDSGNLVVDTVWRFFGRVFSQVSVEWWPKKQLLNVFVHSENNPEYHLTLDFLFEEFFYSCKSCSKEKWLMLEPTKFWERINSILDEEEAQLARFGREDFV